ncbi:MAG: PorT family protein [Sphingobacteriales bacterium]|nr:MAG: PorT family protein [Sphingobacteriales bacterium]
MFKARFLAFLLFTLCVFVPAAKAQKGTQLAFWGGPQYVSLVNVDDYFNQYGQGIKLNRLNTYRFGGGIDLTQNLTDNYGVQTGVYYSQQGQKYDGFLNKPGDTSFFSSHMYLNYIRVPLMFRFNSEYDDQDIVSLSIYGGLQLGILRNVQEVQTTPAIPDSMLARYPNFDFKNLYKKTDLGLALGAQFNIKITPRFGTMIGLRYDRSIGTIENKNYTLPKDAPEEWQYPLSTKKGIGGVDNLTRRPTRISAVNLYTGLTFKIGSMSSSAGSGSSAE